MQIPSFALPRLGLWTASLDFVPLARACELAAGIEQLGYGALWVPEVAGRDVFVGLGALLRSTERLIGATFVGPEVADFLQAGTIAVVGEVPPPTLARALTPKQSRLPRWTVSRTKPIAVSDWRVVLADAGGLTALRLAANRRSGETPPCGSPSECVRPRLRRRDARRLVRWTCVAPSVSACCQSQSKLRRMRSNVRPHRPRSSRWPNSIRGRIRGRASEGACP